MSNAIDVGTKMSGSIFGARFMSMLTPSDSGFQVPGSREHSIGQNAHKVVSFYSPVLMPPLCEVAPSPSQPLPPQPAIPPSPPSPPREPFPPLSEVEEELFDIAIRLDCALHEFDTRGGVVNISHYTNSIVNELVSGYMLRNNRD